MDNKITFRQVIFTLIFGAIIVCFVLWQSHKECEAKLELQEAKQKLGKTVDKLVDALEAKVAKSKSVALNLSYFSEEEVKIITAAAKRNNLKGSLYPVLYAIRKAENGDKRRELGIIHPRCEVEMDKRPNETLDIQAGWAAATVQKSYDRWIEAGSKGRYIEYLAHRFCPVGAANDPDGLNKNWIGNVTHWAEKIRG